MKRFFLISTLAFGLSFFANAVNYFECGTTWIVEHSPHDPANSWIKHIAIHPNGSFAEMYYRVRGMYNESDFDEYNYHPFCDINSEGDKVFFRKDKGVEEWYLLYDFGLEIGEGTYVWFPDGNTILGKPKVSSRYIRRIERPEELSAIPDDYIFIQEFADENCEDPENAPVGWWIPGIGNPMDPCKNIGFGIEGDLAVLREVSTDSGIVYSDWQKKEIPDLNLFIPGTVWTHHVYTCGPQPDDENKALNRVFLGDEIEIEGEKVMTLYRGERKGEAPEPWLYVKVDGHKVYVKHVDTTIPGYNMYDWHLYYDFGLQPGEGAWCVVVGTYNPISTYIKCIGRKPNHLDPSLDVMILEEYIKSRYDDEDSESFYSGGGCWISGIGGIDGDNTYFEAVGGGSHLREVRNGDTVYYEDWNGFNSGIESPKEDHADICRSSSVYNLQGQRVGTSVDGLAPGLYVRVDNGRSEKIRVR